ncbi:MAG TPA: MCE family protein [Nocardioidaceae bacterium]|nr:MCE family protein [Nocardioidaceae bacterium]
MKTLKKLLTNKLYLSLVGVIAVFLVSVSYLITQTLDTPLLNRPDQIVVEMPSTGSIFEGSSVTYRGMKIGKITDIRLNDEGTVEATATITNPIKIPANSDVKVRGLSPVGEQYLDFQPPSEEGPYLENGSRVTATVTDLPRTLASTVINVSKLLDQLDQDDLKTALNGIGAALNGTGDDIGRLADQGYQLLQTLDENWPQTQRLLRNSEILLELGAQNAGKIRTIAVSSAQVADFLKDFDPTLRELLARGPGQFKQVSAVLDAIDEVLPKFLDRATKLTDVFITRDPHLRALLREYPLGIVTLGRAMYDGAINGQLVFQQEYQCEYGAVERPPTDTTTHPVDPDGHCANPPRNRLVRGEANRPPAG